jgi:eukaryotic-like serine/threonine-protein kinase
VNPEPRKSGVITRGAWIGNYEILRKLATGGMAEIYLARITGTAGFEKLVVLKCILPSVAEDQRFVEMFLGEARLAASLHHPNIADVYDVGTSDGSLYFTMEFIHGEDARTVRSTARQAGTPIPLPIALAIVHGTASALHYAHEKTGPSGPLGLVHRDVSASNILVSFDGAIKLVDFGIARATMRQSKTLTGTLKGKIPYMSPEQCRNRPLDRRSDLFSLGVVLFELTVGRRPFDGESDFAILDMIVNRGAPRPTTFDSSYPMELEAIVMRLLASEPDQRYQTGEELLHDLDAFMSARNAWASTNVVGRYMRSLFGDKIAAWEAAAEDGASLGDHVASTITSESMRAARLTTAVSGFSTRPLTPTPTPLPVVRRARRGLWIALAGGAVGAIAGAILLARGGGHTATHDAASVAQPQPPVESSPPPAQPPPPAPPPEAKPPPQPVAPKPAATPSRAGHAPVAKKTKPAKAAPPKPKPDTEGTWDQNSLSLPK